MNERDKNPSTKFTPEEVEDLREAFNLCVKDKPGKVAVNDIGVLLKTVGQTCTDEELHTIVTQASEGDKKFINFNQFLRIMENRRPAPDLESDIHKAFRHFDKGGNGRISMKELRRTMGQLGERLTEEELDDMMREADLNGDRQIDFREFRLVLMNN
ncbi:calmodulin-A-like [Dendronephthya gigantea]|uniref:calmodulin-A-like n=1 Tax=Dendronephthya gigantea TaxID=151771 RepID=UPI00106B2093|nr:calmodulin-A-like [Dendronephthya gigantea]